MPRRPRLVAPEIPLHIIQRGNNRQVCFCIDSDYRVYLALLQRGAVRHGCLIHAYVLMTNHVHLLITPRDTDSPGAMMKAAGERYVRYFNKRYNRTGTLWDGRFRSCLVQNDAYLLVCHRYIELNPVRAGMVRDPSLYAWSSHHRNAYNQPDPLVTPHPIFSQLGTDEATRAHAYRELFADQLSHEQLGRIRDATNCNYSFCNTSFAESMAEALGKQVARCNKTRERMK